MTDPTIEALAKELCLLSRLAVRRRGMAYGTTPFAASVMRPLVSRGLFNRVQEQGFMVRWRLTPLGLAVRTHLLKGSNDAAR